MRPAGHRSRLGFDILAAWVPVVELGQNVFRPFLQWSPNPSVALTEWGPCQMAASARLRHFVHGRADLLCFINRWDVGAPRQVFGPGSADQPRFSENVWDSRNAFGCVENGVSRTGSFFGQCHAPRVSDTQNRRRPPITDTRVLLDRKHRHAWQFVDTGLRVMAKQPDSRRIPCFFRAIFSAVAPFDTCPVGWYDCRVGFLVRTMLR